MYLCWLARNVFELESENVSAACAALTGGPHVTGLEILAGYLQHTNIIRGGAGGWVWGPVVSASLLIASDENPSDLAIRVDKVPEECIDMLSICYFLLFLWAVNMDSAAVVIEKKLFHQNVELAIGDVVDKFEIPVESHFSGLRRRSAVTTLRQVGPRSLKIEIGSTVAHGMPDFGQHGLDAKENVIRRGQI